MEGTSYNNITGASPLPPEYNQVTETLHGQHVVTQSATPEVKPGAAEEGGPEKALQSRQLKVEKFKAVYDCLMESAKCVVEKTPARTTHYVLTEDASKTAFKLAVQWSKVADSEALMSLNTLLLRIGNATDRFMAKGHLFYQAAPCMAKIEDSLLRELFVCWLRDKPEKACSNWVGTIIQTTTDLPFECGKAIEKTLWEVSVSNRLLDEWIKLGCFDKALDFITANMVRQSTSTYETAMAAFEKIFKAAIEKGAHAFLLKLLDQLGDDKRAKQLGSPFNGIPSKRDCRQEIVDAIRESAKSVYSLCDQYLNAIKEKKGLEEEAYQLKLKRALYEVKAAHLMEEMMGENA